MIWETWVRSLGWEDPLEKGKATHSSILAWGLPATWESQRVRRDWETSFLPSFHPLGLLSGYLDLQWLSLTPQEDTVSGEETEEGWGKELKGTEKPGPSQWHGLRTQVQHDFFLSYLPSSFFFFFLLIKAWVHYFSLTNQKIWTMIFLKEDTFGFRIQSNCLPSSHFLFITGIFNHNLQLFCSLWFVSVFCHKVLAALVWNAKLRKTFYL